MTFMVLNLQVLMWSPELRVILMILLAATPSWKIKKQIIEVIEITKKLLEKDKNGFSKDQLISGLPVRLFFLRETWRRRARPRSPAATARLWWSSSSPPTSSSPSRSCALPRSSVGAKIEFKHYFRNCFNNVTIICKVV